MTISTFEQSERLRKKAHALIPGGCHTYAKGDDQYPILSPSHIVRGLGARVWDADGNEYIEYGNGNRAVTLGHAFPAVVEAVKAELSRGVNFTRPSVIEIEAAEKFMSVIGAGEMVKFSKDGSDATSAAVKLARAYTGRDLIAICGDQPFFSVDDWFIGSTAIHGGIPEAIRNLTVKFRYNDIESVKALIAQHPDQIAGFILEAERIDPPRDNFLTDLQRLAREAGALFILDEMITGLRWHIKGAQQVYDLDPRSLHLGQSARQRFFGFSARRPARYYASRRSRADRSQARLPDVDNARRGNPWAGGSHRGDGCVCARAGHRASPSRRRTVAPGLSMTSRRRGLAKHVAIMGRACNLLFSTLDGDGKPSQPFRTLFLQETIKRGIIMPSLVVSSPTPTLTSIKPSKRSTARWKSTTRRP